MSFFLIVIGSLVALGVIAAIFSIGDKDELIVTKEGDCASCSSRSECKLVELMDDGRRKKDDGRCQKDDGRSMRALPLLFYLFTFLLFAASCSTKKNTMQTRFWHSFNARYNTYFNGSQAFIDGCEEKETGNKDDHTQLLPLYTVGNKNVPSRSLRRLSVAIASRPVQSGRSSVARPRRTSNGCRVASITPSFGVPGCC